MPNPTSVCIGTGGNAAIWTAVVRIAGVNVTSQIIGDLRIEGDESAARIAEFTLRPPAGTVINLAGWTGLAVEIDVADNSTGSPTSPARLFTGVIDTPTLDQTTRTLRMSCTDDLQGRCYAMTNTALDTLIGGYSSPAVFDTTAQGWTYAQDQLSTVPKALDISPAGVLRVTPWAAKAVADLTLDADIVGEHSLTPQVADRAGLTNEVRIDFGYRFPRLKAETHHCQYDCVTLLDFATFQLASKSFLQRAQVEAAIKAAGGTIESITYTPLPNYIIAVGSGYWSPGPSDGDLCMGFAAGVSFDYAQTTEERHEITVSNALSIAAIGTRSTTLSGALEGVYPDLTATESSIRLYKAEISGNPPPDIAPALEGNTTAVEVTLTPESNRAAADAAMTTLIAIAKTRILASHRRNRVSATVPLVPTIDLDKTIQINADGVIAKGKCVHVTHTLSPDTGLAISEFSIALCALAGVGITHAEGPTTAPGGTTAANVLLTASATYTFNNSYGADNVFTVHFPQVDSANRDNAVIIIPTTIAAPINEDLFTITI